MNLQSVRDMGRMFDVFFINTNKSLHLAKPDLLTVLCCHVDMTACDVVPRAQGVEDDTHGKSLKRAPTKTAGDYKSPSCLHDPSLCVTEILLLAQSETLFEEEERRGESSQHSYQRVEKEQTSQGEVVSQRIFCETNR